MPLDKLVGEKGGKIKKEGDGRCPECGREGEQRSAIEYKCPADEEQCDVLYWFEW